MARKHTAALLWDIDGTLLNTGRAGVFALQDAAWEVLGNCPDLNSMPTAGLTDVEIAVTIVQKSGAVPETGLVNRFLRAYERHLPAALPKRTGTVLPGVQNLLGHLREREDVLSMLLTGNTRLGARVKLTHYGLGDYFTQGAFSDDTENRTAIARRALEVVWDISPGLSLDRIFVIGDTPHDIRCGQAIGARVIAVATGNYDESTLRALDPWWVLPLLPEPKDFLDRVGVNVARQGNPT